MGIALGPGPNRVHVVEAFRAAGAAPPRPGGHGETRTSMNEPPPRRKVCSPATTAVPAGATAARSGDVGSRSASMAARDRQRGERHRPANATRLILTSRTCVLSQDRISCHILQPAHARGLPHGQPFADSDTVVLRPSLARAPLAASPGSAGAEKAKISWASTIGCSTFGRSRSTISSQQPPERRWDPVSFSRSG